MYPSRCFTCMKVLDWEKWTLASSVELVKRMEEQGYKRFCCRRMMMTSLDTSEQTLGLLNTERLLQHSTKMDAKQHENMYRRWFNDFIPPSSSPLPSIPSKMAETKIQESRIKRLHVCE